MAICCASFALPGGPKITQYTHVTWGANEGAPPGVESIAQTADGYLWIGSPAGLFRFDGVTFEQYHSQSNPPLPSGHVVSLLGLPNGDLWIGYFSGSISLLRNGHVVSYGRREGTPPSYITCLVQDQTGTIWAGSTHGLVRLEGKRWKKVGLDWNFPGTAAYSLYVDRAGTLWVATENTIVFLPKGSRKFHTTGIHIGEVSRFAEAPNGKLWMAEVTRSVRPVPLHTKLAPMDDAEIGVGASGILFARGGDLWITTIGDGLRHVPIPEKLRGKYGRLNPSIEMYTTQNGLSSNLTLCIFQDRDGNIWVGTDRGLDRFRKTSATNPGELSRNPQALPASIRSVVADGQSYRRRANLKLPAGTKNTQIKYTAASLSAPWDVHFRYKLDGFDKVWQDAGKQRTASYMNLGPGSYKFRVIAGDTAGAWSSHAAVVTFTIPPFWYQRTWVQGLFGAVLLLVLWVLYRFRMRQLERQFVLAMGARVDERIRIARELHDTLLQSFHGLLFQFQAARNLLPRRPESAMLTLDEALLATEQALAEGRNAIHDLRPEPVLDRDLPELLTAVGQELVDATGTSGQAPNFRVIVEGKPRRLSSALHNEIYRIGREVIRNAFQHAAARHIEAEIRYDERELRLRVRDDGRGIAPTILRTGGSPGHWGLPGIRERAERIGARLEFWSEAEAGTEVELKVPAAVAYEKDQGNQRARLFRKRSRR